MRGGLAAAEGGQRAASPDGGGGGRGGGGGCGPGGGVGGRHADERERSRLPGGVLCGLVGRVAQAVRDGDCTIALRGLCDILEALGMQPSEKQYEVSVTRVVGGWQGVVTVQMVELSVAGCVQPTAADAMEAAIEEAFLSLYHRVDLGRSARISLQSDSV